MTNYQGNRRRRIPTVAIVAIVLGALLLLGCGVFAVVATVVRTDAGPEDAPMRSTGQPAAHSDSGNRDNPPVDDVELTRCEAGEWGWTDVELRITNHSSEDSDYSITVEVVNGQGQRVDEVWAFADRLRPGQDQLVRTGGLEDVSGYRSVECRLLEVERWASS